MTSAHGLGLGTSKNEKPNKDRKLEVLQRDFIFNFAPSHKTTS